MSKDSSLYVEQFAQDGMSSGRLSGEFWIDTGIPLIVQRYREVMSELGK